MLCAFQRQPLSTVMKSRPKLCILFAGLSLSSVSPALSDENEFRLIERFALASDREKVLGELVPGTENYYRFHALHYQNTRNKVKLAEIMAQWEKRFPDASSERQSVEHREALLTYDTDPQATLEYLKRHLGVEFNHERRVRDKKPDLPTELEDRRIDRAVFLADSLKNNAGLQGLSVQALESLVRDRTQLSVQQRRALLGKLRRPDVPGLVDLIAADFRTQESRSFGEFSIHRLLLPAQLTELLKAAPDLAANEAFVNTWVRKLAPGAEADLEYDTAEREAWLDRVWAYVQKLPASFNSLKAQVLYLRLDHDRKAGVHDLARFTAYLQLPRSFDYVNPRLLDQAARAQAPVSNLGANFSEALLANRSVADDEPLVREYFLHFFSQGAQDVAAAIKPFTPNVRDTWLKPLFAEAMITSGQGNAELWASLLSPAEFQKLKDRVDIEFPPTNTQFFSSGEEVQFDVIVKNTPKLLVKIYEINTLNFFLTQQRQLNTDLNLDGLVANGGETRTFESGPFKRERFQFKLAGFNFAAGKRGAWVVEFIGGGRSSRALVRAGQWQVLQQSGPSGDLLLVVDEKGEPVKDSVVWLDGRKLVRDEKLGRIVVPYTGQPGMKNIVLADPSGSFATFARFMHHGEDYRLDAQFHIDREQLLARRKAKLAIRTSLLLGEAQLALELLSEPRLSITSTTRDGIDTTLDVKDLKLSAGSVLTHELVVPERLASLTVNLEAKVDVLSDGGEKRTLSATHTWTLNGIDKTAAVQQACLSTFGGQQVFELLGKNGEPAADQQVVFTFKHRDFERVQNVSLRTDEKGRVQLGALPGIAAVTARLPDGRSSVWPLESALRTWSSEVNALEGEAVMVPVMNDGPEWKPADLSLLETKAGTFTADLSASLALQPGFVQITGLKAGDYKLYLRPLDRTISIKVTQGPAVAGWYLGRNRNLEAKGTRSLQIVSVKDDSDVITFKLANTTAFTRVHVAASRFEAGRGLFEGLGNFARFGAASGVPAKLPTLYSAGREIGDEYRYILERRYAKIYPGNMLSRPGLLLNPWEIRSTELEELNQQAGEGAGATKGGSGGGFGRARAESAAKPQVAGSGAADNNIDFLADVAPLTYNLVPDKNGEVRITRKELGDRQQVQVYAEDLNNAVWRKFSLPERGTKFADQRLARNLDPVQPFVQKKSITVLAQGKSLTLADILTSEMETYDSLSGIHALFTTLNSDQNLARFAWILQWPKLKDEEKRAKYSEFACHELNFFIARKDQAFFDAVVKPYLANKKDKTFMDHFLLGGDLKPYQQPWAFDQLNAVERCLLGQRLQAESKGMARHLRELWELQPSAPEQEDFWFETALRGRAMVDVGGVAADRYVADKDVAGSGAVAGMINPAPPPAPMSPAAVAPAPVTTMSAADPFAAPEIKAKAGRSMTVAEGVALLQRAEMPKLAADVEAQKLMEERENVTLGTGSLRMVAGKEMATGDTTLNYFGRGAVVDARQSVRAYFRPMGATKEWAENNYYQIRQSEQNGKLVTVNAFWRDFAAWIAEGSKGGFVSSHVAEATHSFAEMMLALAVLDLPFESSKHVAKAEGGRLVFTAGGPVIVYHKEIQPAAPADAKQVKLLVSQSFFRHSDRYEERGNEKFEKYVTEEFLTGEVYGANVVVTNPTSSPAKADVLMQIPQGALPLLNSKATSSRQVQLAPYTTQTFEYGFYFPSVASKPGAKFPHFPVNVAVAGAAAGNAKPFEFNVVTRFTQVDKASWEYVSQDGSEAEVFDYLASNNLERIDLEKIAWRCRESVEFYRKLAAFLSSHRVWRDVIASYSVLHNDAAGLREYLKFHGEFISLCGDWLASPLITIDPVERYQYEHLEYSPLVNQRAHRLGGEWRIANPAVLEQYRRLVGILAQKPKLDDADSMSVVYYFFLQDRVEEALARFASINAAALPTRLQHDYFKCYAAFYEGKLDEARTVAAAHANEPVVRWKTLFSEVTSQIDEIEGKNGTAPAKDGKPDREKQQEGLASTEPALDLKVENRTITIGWKNIGEVTLNFYLMDPEFSFSSSPFVSQDASRFSIIKPRKVAVQALPVDKDSISIALPEEFARENVLVEAVAAGMRKAQAYHANTLKLTVTENYGRLETLDSGTGKPVSKAYVKVYAKLNNGTLRFFKDGYTDLRGRFDYASLNGPDSQPGAAPVNAAADAPPANGLDYQMLKPNELSAVQKLAVLVLSDTNGAEVKEVNPPSQ